jgi:hypothetical protein
MQSFLLRRLRLVGGERDADLPFALSETSIPLGGLLFDLSCPWCAFGDVGDVLALADNPTNNAYLLNVCRWFTCLPVFVVSPVATLHWKWGGIVKLAGVVPVVFLRLLYCPLSESNQQYTD